MIMLTITSVLLLLGIVLAAIECSPGGSAAASAALADAPRLLQERLRAEWASQEAGLPSRQPLPGMGPPIKGGGGHNAGEGTAMKAIARAHAASSGAGPGSAVPMPAPLPPLPLLSSASGGGGGNGGGYGSTGTGAPPPVQLATGSGRAAAAVRAAGAAAGSRGGGGPRVGPPAGEGLVSSDEDGDAPRPVRRAPPRAAPQLPPAPAPPRPRAGRASDDESSKPGGGSGSDWRFPGMAPATADEDDAPGGGGAEDNDEGPPAPSGPPPARDALRRASSNGAILGLRSPVGGGRLRAAASSKRLAPANAREARDDDL
jgi:hypothetical protein